MDTMRNFMISKINEMNGMFGTELPGYDPFYDTNEGLLKMYDVCREQFKINVDCEKKYLLEKYKLDPLDAVKLEPRTDENEKTVIHVSMDKDKIIEFKEKIKQTMLSDDFERYTKLISL